MDLAIVQTGTANIASVVVAFERLGVSPRITREPETVREAGRIVLPGVGTFAAGMARLKSDRLIDEVRQRIENGRPTLGICLGLQIFGVDSEESPSIRGLGVLDASVRRLGKTASVPQIGWNRVRGNGGLVTDGWAYFANSFAFEQAPTGWIPALADHGGTPFVAAVQRGPVLGCQFHPELSGAWGERLLARWLEASC